MGKMGKIWRGPVAGGVPEGVYKEDHNWRGRGSGTVWRGPVADDPPEGFYKTDQIFSGGSGVAAGRYDGGKLWRGGYAGGDPDGRYGGGKIWRGPVAVGEPVGRYDGPDDGAAAAAILLGIV